jgi:dCMP deaminase
MKRLIDKWDVHFLRLAREASLMSKDPSSQVGAVIVQNRRVISTGYNGFPSRIADDKRLHDRSAKLGLIVHAEMNALLQAGPAARGGTLFIWGFMGAPCLSNCTKHIIAADIDRVVASGRPVPERWADDLREAEKTLEEAGVALRFYCPSELDRRTNQ